MATGSGERLVPEVTLVAIFWLIDGSAIDGVVVSGEAMGFW